MTNDSRCSPENMQLVVDYPGNDPTISQQIWMPTQICKKPTPTATAQFPTTALIQPSTNSHVRIHTSGEGVFGIQPRATFARRRGPWPISIGHGSLILCFWNQNVIVSIYSNKKLHGRYQTEILFNGCFNQVCRLLETSVALNEHRHKAFQTYQRHKRFPGRSILWGCLKIPLWIQEDNARKITDTLLWLTKPRQQDTL